MFKKRRRKPPLPAGIVLGKLDRTLRGMARAMEYRIYMRPVHDPARGLLCQNWMPRQGQWLSLDVQTLSQIDTTAHVTGPVVRWVSLAYGEPISTVYRTPVT